MAYLDPAVLRGEPMDIYVRKSKAMKGGRESESVKEQLEGCRRDAGYYGFVERTVFSDDGIGASRYSAVKIREGFDGMLTALRNDPPKVLAMWEQSRSSRDAAVSIQLLDLLQEKGIFLLVRGRLKDPRDPEDRKQLIEGAAAAEYESAIIRERTLRAMAGAAAKGKAHGQTPYGYKRVYNEFREQVDQVPHPEQAPVVKEVVRRVLKGESSHAIAKDLTKREVVRPYGGTTWHPTEIRDLCLLPAYRGLREDKGKLIPAIWAKNRLISDKEFAALERVFAARSAQRGEHSTAAKHPLTGIAWCERCDGPMYKDKSKSKHAGSDEVRYAYHCQKGSCGRQRDAVHCERLVRDFFNDILSDPSVLRAWAAGGNRTDVEDLQKQEAELQAELDEAYQVGLSARGLAAIEQRILPQLEDLERKLKAAQGDADDERVLASAPRSLPEDWNEARALIVRLRGRLLCSEAKRGNKFDYDSVTVVRAS